MKLIGSPWVKLGCYMIIAAITPLLAFMGDFFGAWKEDRSVVFAVPSWVWVYQGLLGLGNIALVLRSFLDQSYGRHAEEQELIKQDEKTN